MSVVECVGDGASSVHMADEKVIEMTPNCNQAATMLAAALSTFQCGSHSAWR